MSGPPALTGYLSRQYAEALEEFGTPRELSQAGGWLLERPIGDTGLRDAMGCYPLFCCRDWSRLAADLDAIGPALVSVTIVADPFGDHTPALLAGTFDRIAPFKDHYVAELGPGREIGSKHHRYYARRAVRSVEIEPAATPEAHLDEWIAAYGTLTARHGLTGLHAFSRESFARQLATPGMVLLRALHQDRFIAAHMWFVQGDVAYSHLQATTAEGYALNAAYALYADAIGRFGGVVRWLDLGAAAGAAAEADGLDRFKRGWATTTRPAYLCGRTNDPLRYAELAAGRHTSYYPAYRAGEFRQARGASD